MKYALLLSILVVNAARAAYTEFYIDLVGGRTNSGHTASSNPTFAFQNGNWDATTGIYTAAGASLTAVTNGSWASVYIDAAAEAVFIGRVTAVDDGADTITVSLIYKMGTAPTTSATARSITVGGCWSFPNGTTTDFPFSFVNSTAIDALSNAPCINIKSNIYSQTGQITYSGVNGICEGYLTTPHDGGRPIISSSTGSSFVMAECGGGNWMMIKNLEFDCNFTGGTSAGINTGVRDVVIGVVIRDARGSSFQSSADGAFFIGCESINSLASGFTLSGGPGSVYQCISHNNTLHGFVLGTTDASVLNCIAYSNLGSGFVVTGNTFEQKFINCDSYGNATNGFDLNLGNLHTLINCNMLGNGRYGIFVNTPLLPELVNVYNCGFGSGSQTNALGNIVAGVGNVNETGSIIYPSGETPWKSPLVGNFSIYLRNAKGVGYNGFLQKDVLQINRTIGYPDIGAAQAASTNAGAGSFTFAQ